MNKEKVSYTKTQFKKEFARLMEKTSIPNTFSQEESVKVLKELHEHLHKTYTDNYQNFYKDKNGNSFNTLL